MAFVYGYLVFDELPDYWTLLGTAIIVAAGIYTLERGNRVGASTDSSDYNRD